MDGTAANSADAIFHMKPADAIVSLARIFVDDQRKLANMREMIKALPGDAPADAVTDMRRRLDALSAQWGSEQAPTLAASFRLALEVLDTYGPDGVRVEDPTDAAIWNNKYFVWLREFGGTPPDQQHRDEGGSTGS